MEREKIISEFFKLQLLLNKSNKVANLKTQIDFKIEIFGETECRILGQLKGSGESHKMILAVRGLDRTWERGGYTELKNLESFLAGAANEAERRLDFSELKILNLSESNSLIFEIKDEVKRLTSYIF